MDTDFSPVNNNKLLVLLLVTTATTTTTIKLVQLLRGREPTTSKALKKLVFREKTLSFCSKKKSPILLYNNMDGEPSLFWMHGSLSHLSLAFLCRFTS